jgi:hypothetical protein
MPARFLIVAIGFVVPYRWTRPNETIWPSLGVDTISRNLQPAPDSLASKREFNRTTEFVGDKTPLTVRSEAVSQPHQRISIDDRALRSVDLPWMVEVGPYALTPEAWDKILSASART